MKKDNIKNILLVLLIVSSLFLTKQLWFNKKLWSPDYNFFANFRIIDRLIDKVIKHDKLDVIKEYLFYPKTVTVNNQKRNIYYFGEEMYNSFINEAVSVFVAINNRQTDIIESRVERQEWINALKSKSIKIDFGIIVDSDMLENILGLDKDLLEKYVENVKEILIIPESGLSKKIVVYFKDTNNDIKKLTTEKIENNFGELFDQQAQSHQTVYTYSFERGFDVKRVNKILINSEVLLPISDFKADIIKGSNPYADNISEFFNNIMNTFEYSSTVFNQYTESDDTRVLVKNYSTLTMNPNGFVEYKVMDPENGINLADSLDVAAPSDLKLDAALNMAIEFMEKINILDASMRISSNLINVEEGSKDSYRFTFDYYYKGKPIVIYNERYGEMHAAEIEISGNYLKYFKGYYRRYEKVSTEQTDRNMLEALDMLYKNLDKEEMVISKIFIGYIEEGKSEKYMPQWNFKIDEDATIYAIPAIK